MSTYELKGKYAIVTGAGSGICAYFTLMLLEAGCSVILADIKLRPEAEAFLTKYPHPATSADTASAVFCQTDLVDWKQIKNVWDFSLQTFPRIDILCNGAGLYEPPESTFWNPPGISPLAGDDEDACPGIFKTFAVNTMAPIRLTQIAINYWMEHRSGGVQGNLLWVASLGGYLHSLQTPLYFASKAAVVSVVKSLEGLRGLFGIRNACVCPGACYTPIFHPAYCADRVRPGDYTMTPAQCAGVMVRVLTEAQFGDGNVVEVMAVGSREEPELSVRETPLEALYPTAGVRGEDNHLLQAEEDFVKRLVGAGSIRGLSG